jgi:hypothetical protein
LQTLSCGMKILFLYLLLVRIFYNLCFCESCFFHNYPFKVKKLFNF